MCFYSHFLNFSKNLGEIRNMKSAHNECWAVLGFAKTDVVKIVLEFDIENFQKFIGDCKPRHIGSSAGHKLLRGCK